jgi:hypothetical protein
VRPIAAPVLVEVEKQPAVREAWLNRKGTIIGGVSGAPGGGVGRDAFIAVHFVNGKVALKTCDKPAGS